VVKPSAAALHREIVDAWTARDREALRALLSPDLFTEWALRLDDFDRKGWHNVTELLAEPEVEYLGLVNREDDADDRVVVRVEAHLRDYVVDRQGRQINRTDETGAETVLAEYWVLGKRDGRWYLMSTEQDAEGGHHIESAIIATPWADDERLTDEAATERGVAAAVADDQVGQLADVDFEGSARTAALDLATMDGRFAPDVIEASVRRSVAAWVEAVDGDDTALERVTSPEAAAELLHPGDPSRRTRLVVRGARVDAVRITSLDAQAQPPALRVEVVVEGRRYVQDRDTIAVVSGSKDQAVRFTEFWTLRLDGADDTPWRISATGLGQAAWGALGSEPEIPASLREKLRRA
jgi:predicted lipid-binding transport protein (Tim44 family)